MGRLERSKGSEVITVAAVGLAIVLVLVLQFLLFRGGFVYMSRVVELIYYHAASMLTPPARIGTTIRVSILAGALLATHKHTRFTSLICNNIVTSLTLALTPESSTELVRSLYAVLSVFNPFHFVFSFTPQQQQQQ